MVMIDALSLTHAHTNKPHTPFQFDFRIAGLLPAGKTLQAIALLHTVMNDPSMKKKDGDPLVKTALLIVPVNTIMNWEHEFDHWLRKESDQQIVYNLHSVEANSRELHIARWADRGGFLLISEMTFRRLDEKNTNIVANADVVCLDEAHQMLKNSTTVMYKKLSTVKTRRRIGRFRL